jgi:tRNA threonylcarbamoyladenosine biosynthesis protein TsaE
MKPETIKYFEASDLQGMKNVSQEILNSFPDNRIFFLKGNLGAGKTTLIQYFCENIGVTEQVVSPSFALVNIYKSPKGDIYHLDLYRLKKQEEAVDLGIEDYLYSGNYVFIEWPELIADIYYSDLIEIDIRLINKEIRKIEVEKR